MTFIKSYHSYFPHFRISDKTLHPRIGRKGVHAVAYTDEDVLTMAYEAAQHLDKNVDAILFATTCPVFKDRYHASYLADLLGLNQGIIAMDFGTTERAGTDALLMGDQLIASGKCKNVLVVASELKYTGIGKETREGFGHCAVAFILSADPGIAEIKYASSFSAALAEEFEYKGNSTQYDARFARTAGFKFNIDAVLKSGIDAGEVDRIILNSPYSKLALGQLKKAGFDLENQLMTDDLPEQVGTCGAAHALVLIIQALEANSGSFLVFDYHNGTNLISIASNSVIEVPTVNTTASESIELYQDYLQLRINGKHEGKGYEAIEMFSSEMIAEREKDQLLYLKADQCTACGTIYYMKAERCNACHSSDFKQTQLNKTGTVYSCTSEYYFPSSFPPTNMIVIDMDGGGRITVQQTDDMFPNEKNIIKIGDRVRLVLRKMMENDKKPNYFWKCVKL